VDDIPILGRDDERRILNELTAQYDVPAYIRRARHVQQALDDLLGRCRRQREEWLLMVRTRLGLLRALAGNWAALVPWLAGEAQQCTLQELHALVEPRLRLRVEPTSSSRRLRRALQELAASIERFNRRWQAFLPTVDVTEVNRLRDGYNRYYLLEKECAVRSARLAQQGFRRLEPLDAQQLAELLPPLPVPLLVS
jgi:hypothetical protein